MSFTTEIHVFPRLTHTVITTVTTGLDTNRYEHYRTPDNSRWMRVESEISFPHHSAENVQAAIETWARMIEYDGTEITLITHTETGSTTEGVDAYGTRYPIPSTLPKDGTHVSSLMGSTESLSKASEVPTPSVGTPSPTSSGSVALKGASEGSRWTANTYRVESTDGRVYMVEADSDSLALAHAIGRGIMATIHGVTLAKVGRPFRRSEPITDGAGYMPCGCHGSAREHACTDQGEAERDNEA